MQNTTTLNKIDIASWKRRAHFEFFSQFEEPYFGITWQVDMTLAKQHAKEQGVSLFIYYLHMSLEAAMAIENFKYRITADNEVVLLETISASATLMRDNETFGFSYIPYHKDIHIFTASVRSEMDRVQHTEDLFPPINTDDVMHCSAIPWMDFSSITHSRLFKAKDSVPKISYGQITEKILGVFTMPVALYVHHGLIDGLHVSRYKDMFQQLLDGNV